MPCRVSLFRQRLGGKKKLDIYHPLLCGYPWAGKNYRIQLIINHMAHIRYVSLIVRACSRIRQASSYMIDDTNPPISCINAQNQSNERTQRKWNNELSRPFRFKSTSVKEALTNSKRHVIKLILSMGAFQKCWNEWELAFALKSFKKCQDERKTCLLTLLRHT